MKFTEFRSIACLFLGLSCWFAMVSEAGAQVAAQEETRQEETKEELLESMAKWIVGKWEVDMDKSFQAAEDIGLDEQEIEDFLANKVVMDFDKKGGVLIEAMGIEMEGDYELVKAAKKDDQVRFVIGMVVIAQDQEQSIDLECRQLSKDSVWIRPSEESGAPPLVFVKAKKKDK